VELDIKTIAQIVSIGMTLGTIIWFISRAFMRIENLEKEVSKNKLELDKYTSKFDDLKLSLSNIDTQLQLLNQRVGESMEKILVKHENQIDQMQRDIVSLKTKKE
jgi:chromosome segregation ATPase